MKASKTIISEVNSDAEAARFAAPYLDARGLAAKGVKRVATFYKDGQAVRVEVVLAAK